jgi:glycosyltransferase involved in cell wall biosynthesis
MKISCITAGAGRMYCGSCLRDNTLAQALIDAGHDVLLIPAYTPSRTDETNVSLNKVFLGGVNVFLQQRFGLFRRAPRYIDRLWDFKPLLRLVSRLGISVDPADLGGLTVSMLRGTKGPLRKEIARLVQFLLDVASPEIINLPNSLLIALAPAIKAVMKAPICCTLQGEDLFLEGLGKSYKKEAIQLIREHAQSVDAFIAVSDYGAGAMAEYLGIERNRIRVAPLGVNFKGFGDISDNSRTDPFIIGYLARLAPEKGLHVLCEAYRALRSRKGLPSSQLWAAGYLAPEHKSYLSGIQEKLGSWGLADHFHYQGELDRREKIEFLKKLSVFSVPEPYEDPKGLFLLEAMAAGIPVVQPRRGAFTEIIEKTGGGILVEPDKPDALAQGIFELWNDPGKRTELALRGYQGVRLHYSATKMAAAALDIYKSLLEKKGSAADTR